MCVLGFCCWSLDADGGKEGLVFNLLLLIDRVKNCSDENLALQKRVRLLETEKKSLISQLKRLQTILTGQGGGAVITPVPANLKKNASANTNANGGVNGIGSNPSTAQPATCLLVLLLSFAHNLQR